MQPSDIALNTLNNCLLCHSLAATRIATIHFDDIWDSLKNNLGAVFSVGVIERHTPSNDTGLTIASTRYAAEEFPKTHHCHKRYPERRVTAIKLAAEKSPPVWL